MRLCSAAEDCHGRLVYNRWNEPPVPYYSSKVQRGTQQTLDAQVHTAGSSRNTASAFRLSNQSSIPAGVANSSVYTHPTSWTGPLDHPERPAMPPSKWRAAGRAHKLGARRSRSSRIFLKAANFAPPPAEARAVN